MTALLATDLDRTMIYSRGAMNAAADDAVCVEVYQGAPLSYMTPAAVARYAELAQRFPLVPVTTRIPEQYFRVTLPGPPPRYAVASNGGRILLDGVSDDAWRAAVDAEVAAQSAPLTAVHEEISRRIGDWAARLRIADELFCYLVVDRPAQPPEFLAGLARWCAPRGWNVSQQGRKIYAMPNAVTKSSAIAEVRRRLIDEGGLPVDAPLLAAGDGRLDQDLLVAADLAIRPAHGELAETGWLAPHVEVTRSAGIDAGEEILAWFADRAGRTAAPGGAATYSGNSPIEAKRTHG